MKLLCPTFCDPVDCSLPGPSVLGIFQARVLEWVAISFSRGFSQPRDRTQVSCIAGRIFTVWATREALLSICCYTITGALSICFHGQLVCWYLLTSPHSCPRNCPIHLELRNNREMRDNRTWCFYTSYSSFCLQLSFLIVPFPEAFSEHLYKIEALPSMLPFFPLFLSVCLSIIYLFVCCIPVKVYDPWWWFLYVVINPIFRTLPDAK